MANISNIQLKVGLEIHIELATRTKMFSTALSPAYAGQEDATPNSFIDPTVLALPGALPVFNKRAIEMAMLVGMALGCTTASKTKWDRKGYFYPDLPKSYQISQYDLPLSFDGRFDLPAVDREGFPDFTKPPTPIGIIRAHLEEDAGKLLHEAPGGGSINYSIIDYNRAGTPLLEVVTAPDFQSADDVVLFARLLRQLCRVLGVTQGIMQKGHMRFEPNINCILTLDDGRVVRTPIVEIKNLNSFKSVKGAIEFELREQPRRWQADGREMGAGMKITRGWDDARLQTFVQREKEDAHDYRYFPDPDLVPVVVDDAWKNRIAGELPELPLRRYQRYVHDYALGVKEASILVEERPTSEYFDAIVDAVTSLGTPRPRAGKAVANILLQSGGSRANTLNLRLDELGAHTADLAALVHLRETGCLGNQAVDDLFGILGDTASRDIASRPSATTATPAACVEWLRALASARGVLITRDDAAMAAWIMQVVAANPKVADDVRGGKVQAVGRLVGEVMKLAGGAADAKTVREELLKALGAG